MSSSCERSIEGILGSSRYNFSVYIGSGEFTEPIVLTIREKICLQSTTHFILAHSYTLCHREEVCSSLGLR